MLNNISLPKNMSALNKFSINILQMLIISLTFNCLHVLFKPKFAKNLKKNCYKQV